MPVTAWPRWHRCSASPSAKPPIESAGRPVAQSSTTSVPPEPAKLTGTLAESPPPEVISSVPPFSIVTWPSAPADAGTANCSVAPFCTSSIAFAPAGMPLISAVTGLADALPDALPAAPIVTDAPTGAALSERLPVWLITCDPADTTVGVDAARLTAALVTEPPADTDVAAEVTGMTVAEAAAETGAEIERDIMRPSDYRSGMAWSGCEPCLLLPRAVSSADEERIGQVRESKLYGERESRRAASHSASRLTCRSRCAANASSAPSTRSSCPWPAEVVPQSRSNPARAASPSSNPCT